MDKKNRTRAGLVVGLVALVLAGARFGRLTGRAAGEDDSAGGCGAPPEVSATKGGPVASAAVARPERALRMDRRLRMHRELGQLSHHNARPATPPEKRTASPSVTP